MVSGPWVDASCVWGVHADGECCLICTERGELKLATSWFETAMRQGSPFEAYYYLGSIYGDQAKESMMSDGGVSGSCPMAVAFHKLVAERGAGWGWGTWGGGSEEGEDLLREAEDAWTSGTERGREMALLKWRIAAEQGFEVAQNNLAFVLDQGERGLWNWETFALLIAIGRQEHSPPDSLLAVQAIERDVSTGADAVETICGATQCGRVGESRGLLLSWVRRGRGRASHQVGEGGKVLSECGRYSDERTGDVESGMDV
jgi:hypothetical protein